MNGKREMIKELTNSAWSILSKYENDERNGLLSREEAQRTAVSRIQYLRYGEEMKDYFWITDMTPTMIIHPYRPDLNGKDLRNVSDPHGKKLFVEFVNTVKQNENGYVDYMWQWKDDSLHIVPKLSYVQLFKPWGWVIGTGIYIEDVKKEIKALTRKLLWLSIGISFIIAFLLFFISQQSLKIERQRIQAEKELHDSKEKYRTLVEAATEGLIMLIDGKISFLNNVITSLTGFADSELLNHSINELISENNQKDIVKFFTGETVKEGQYEVKLKRKQGGFVEVLLTATATMLNDKKVMVVIVKDISIDRNSKLSGFDYPQLTSILNMGLFRVKLDSKAKIIDANESAMRLLEFETFKELYDLNILELLAGSDEKKNVKEELVKHGFIKNRILHVTSPNKESGIISITMVRSGNDNPEELIYDGIIEDISLQENNRIETDKLITQLKANNFLIEQPIQNYARPFYTLDIDSTIGDAVKALADKKTDHLLITKNKVEFIGIITNNDIQQRVLSLHLNLENPVYLIMSSPLKYIREDDSILNALTFCEEKNIHHLVVKNVNEDIIGVLNINDLYRFSKDSLSFLMNKVKSASDIHEIKSCYKTLQMLIKPLIHNEISVKFVTAITSAFSDAVIKRTIQLAIDESGEPPADFSFICLGSEGRKEETLYTDQDNAIIYDEVSPEKAIFVQEYFSSIGEKICNSLNYIGYAFCKGNIMAKNAQWCKPINVWEKYFASWITTPEPQNLLDATIFFDFRFIYGDITLTERLSDFIGKLMKENPLFFYHLANNTFKVKPEQITSGNIISDKNAENVDLKNAVNLIIMFVRTYALQNNILVTNTLERLTTLKTKHIIADNTADELVYVYNFLMKMRLRNQLRLAEENLPLSNTLNTKKLINVEVSILKKVLSLLPLYQVKLNNDFRLTS